MRWRDICVQDTLLLIVALAILALLLCGCSSLRMAKTVTRTTETKRGITTVPVVTPQGTQMVQAPYTEIVERDQLETTDEESRHRPDVPAIASAAAGLVGTAASVAGGPAGFGLTELAGAAVTALVSGGIGTFALHKNGQAKQLAKDAEDAWAEAEKHRQRAEEYALKLPPTST